MATISPPVHDFSQIDDSTPPPLPGRSLTFDEFLDWCRGYEKVRVEWVDGEVVIMSPVNLNHGDLNVWLGMILRGFAEQHDLGRVLGPEIMCRFQSKTREVGLVPDVLFIAADRLNILKRTHIAGAPDLVIEIVSPDSSSRDYREKYHDYESGGVREYWVVNPLSKRVEVWARNEESGEFRALIETEGQFTSKVLPGFFLRPEWLWREPLPKVSEVLRLLGV